jgi:hypothetical protein
MPHFAKPGQKFLQTLHGIASSLLHRGSLDFVIFQVGQSLQHKPCSRAKGIPQHKGARRVETMRTLQAFRRPMPYFGQFGRYLSRRLDHLAEVVAQNLEPAQPRCRTLKKLIRTA